MKISLDWLRDFVTWDETPAELAEKLTCLGLNVEGIETFRIEFPNVVVAEVRKVGTHPNADRLSVCSVFDGKDVAPVVCGAPNVRAGQRVLLARPGARLPGDLHIKKTKIRGVESMGMICSETELELGTDASGIMELSEDWQPGTPADELYGFHDTVLEIEVTPNRPDWLSHLGVAREIAAINGTKISLPSVWSDQSSSGESMSVTVDIADFGDCPRYTAHGATHVQIAAAPNFIRNRLISIGSRPINNIVDITNYVLFETGQPLHAFDRQKLDGNRIFVRRAGSEEKICTLDGLERTLKSDHLIIADGAGPVAIAGVMGGEGSQVDEQTQEIILESAFFDPQIVRRTRRELGLNTDSSYRFEREADWDMVDFAAKRALLLMQQHAEARIFTDWVDRQNPDRKPQPDLPLRISQVNRVLGTQLDSAEVVRLLQQLSLKVVPLGKASDSEKSATNMMVQVPSFRRDLKMEVDLIEEVARLFGYDNVPSRGHFRGSGGGSRRLIDQILAKTRRFLAGCGYFEMTTSSFFQQEDRDRMQLTASDPRRECLQIANPHHGGEILLRTSMLPSFLRVAQHNINADNTLPIKLFQINKIFWPAQKSTRPGSHPDEHLLPAEPLFLQFGLAGDQKTVWGEVPADLMEIKGVLENLAEFLQLSLKLEFGDDQPYLAEGCQWRILDRKGLTVGHAGSISAQVLEAFDIEQSVAVAELEFSKFDLSLPTAIFKPFSRFPAVKRDLSLVVPAEVTFQQLQDVVGTSGGDLLESVELFDIYRGKEISESGYAVGIRLKFRSEQGNLKGTTVDKRLEIIQNALAEQLSIHLRG